MLEIRELTADNAVELQNFRCHQQNQWTKQVQRTIRTDVVDLVSGALDQTSATASGGFVSEALIAVAVWSAAEHFEVLYLATAEGHQGHGHGRELKQHLLTTAANMNYRQVFSLVHRANSPMLALNVKLDAWIEPDDQDLEMIVCVINTS